MCWRHRLLALMRSFNQSADFCFWHKADTAIALIDVRFQGQSGHQQDRPRCPLLTARDIGRIEIPRCNKFPRHRKSNRQPWKWCVLQWTHRFRAECNHAYSIGEAADVVVSLLDVDSAVSARRDAHGPAEDTRQMRLVGETGYHRHFA